MSLPYRSLILDHDDTVVDSTAAVHFPAYLEALKRFRPEVQPLDLRGWFRKNFHPGIMSLLRDELRLTDEEMVEEYQLWRSFALKRRPRFFPGMIELLSEYSRLGGRIAVVSHSESDIIERDYRETGGGVVVPEIILGWELEESQRKPEPWPVFEVMRRLSLDAEDILVVDDLKPAVLMAQAAGVDIAAAGWAHQIPEIMEYMKENCTYFCETLEELRAVILGGNGARTSA